MGINDTDKYNMASGGFSLGYEVTNLGVYGHVRVSAVCGDDRFNDTAPVRVGRRPVMQG